MSDLPAGWRYARLNDLGTVERGRSRHRPRNDPSLYGGNHPFVQTGDIKAAGLRLYRYTQTYSDTGLAQSRLWPINTLCMTIAANIGDTAILGIPACFPDSIVGFTAFPDTADVVFVKYALDFAKQRFGNISRGATQDNLSLEKLLSQDLPTPPLVEQRRIASILGAYDDLIEVNRRRIALLEEMARRLFEEWFVHERVPIDVSAEFVPMVLGDVAEIEWGDLKTTKASYVSKGYAAYSASGADGFLDHFDHEGLGIVLSAIGAQCGKIWLVDGRWSCIKNTMFLKARDNRTTTLILYLLLNKEDVWPKRGAAQPFISLGDARKIPLRLPSFAVQHKFDQLVAPMLSLRRALASANKLLTESRDLLLPRLISGELPVSAAERELEAVA